MKEYSRENIRTIGLLGHGSAGKTSFAEAALFTAGSIDRLGRIDEGTATLDFEPEELKRNISISSTFHHWEWKEKRVIVADTPGETNFLPEAMSTISVIDGAVFIFDAIDGVKFQTERLWAAADSFKIPRLCIVNKMDRERADFFKALAEAEGLLGVQVHPFQIPIGAEESFEGAVDLISLKAFKFKTDQSGKHEEIPIPDNLKSRVDEYRDKLVEAAAEADDTLLEKYLEGETLSDEEIQNGLRKGVLARTILPVFCLAAVPNKGTQLILDAIGEFLPSPLDRGEVVGKLPGKDEKTTRACDEAAPFSGFVFKTLADPFAGRLTIFRVYSGTLQADSKFYNATKETEERFGQIFMLEGKKQTSVGTARPGDIVAVAKLKSTTTGDSLCIKSDQILFPELPSANPVISFAIRPKSKGDEDKVAISINRLREEDTTLTLRREEQTKELIISGMGQIHMDATIEKMKRKFGVEVELTTPKIPYKETIKKEVKGVIYRHKKQSGGRGQFAEVHFDISPLEKGGGFEFEEALVGMNVPRNFVPAVEKGLNESLPMGILAGNPLVDIKVRFYDGKSHDVDSSEMAFKIAASMCLKKGLQNAKPVLLEPIFKMEIFVPDDAMGDVMGDLNSRRGRVQGMDSKGSIQIIKAEAPLAEIIKYAPDLHSMTSGRGTFTMEFSRYEEVPAQLSGKIIEAAEAEKEKS